MFVEFIQQSPMSAFVTLFVTCVASVFLWILLVVSRARNRLAKKGVPLIRQSLVSSFGIEAILMKESPGEFYLRQYRGLKGERMGGMCLMSYPILIICDPEIVRRVLVQDFESFTDRGIPTDVETDPLEGHLFNLPGAHWRALRYKMSPAFTGSKLRWMSGLIRDCADKLVGKMDGVVSTENTVEMTDWLSRFTTDVIASTAFGMEVEALDKKNGAFLEMSRQALNLSPYGMFVVIVRLICPSLTRLVGLRTIPKKVNDFFFSVTSQVLKHREETGEKRSDFVQLLLQLKQKGSMDFDPREKNEDDEDYDAVLEQKDTIKIEFTESVLAAQSFVFFVAGYETTAATLGFTLYYLSKYQDCQDRLREEVRRIKKENGGRVDYDSVKEMTYLDCCISEALRLYPPLPFLNRECTKTLVLDDGTIIEKGTAVIIPVWGLHLDSRYFPEPETFRPERFLDPDDPTKTRKPAEGTYIPFGDGPRMCIGRRFALLEAKLAIAKMIDNFSIVLSPKTQDPPKIMPSRVISQPVDGLWFQLARLSQ